MTTSNISMANTSSPYFAYKYQTHVVGWGLQNIVYLPPSEDESLPGFVINLTLRTIKQTDQFPPSIEAQEARHKYERTCSLDKKQPDESILINLTKEANEKAFIKSRLNPDQLASIKNQYQELLNLEEKLKTQAQTISQIAGEFFL